LDGHQARCRTFRHRCVTIEMLARVFLVVTTAAERRAGTIDKTLITLTVNEFRLLFDTLSLCPVRAVAGEPAWSNSRRRHQAIARDCHHRKHH
jgi:hypothetical protein